jgi:hypothetical protein
MYLRFTQGARKHKIGRAVVLELIRDSEFIPITTPQGEDGLLFIGIDSRGRELEVGVATAAWPELGVVIHAMPMKYRRN